MSRVWYALTPGPRSTLRQSGPGELAIPCWPRWGRRVAERSGARRLPAFQSSPSRAWQGSTPRLPCCGRSRTLRLGLAKRGKLARPGTVSHSSPAPAPAPAGRRLIAGPKDTTPTGAWNWMIGVPVSHRGERFAGLLADSRIGRSVFEPRQPVRLAGPPGPGRGQEGAGAAVSAIGMAGTAGGVEQAGADGRVPRRGRARSWSGRRRAAASARQRDRLVSRREMVVVVHGRVDHRRRDESPAGGVITLDLHHPRLLTGQPCERAHRIDVRSRTYASLIYLFSSHAEVAGAACARR